MKKPHFLFLLVCLIIYSHNASSQEDDSNDIDYLLGLSLEELMNISVVSASKKSESIQDAPSIIVTVSSEEIKDFGGNNLYEVLERVTGFYGISSYVFPQNSIALRTDFPNHINPNILFLINGRPFRESPKGGQNVGILTAFPINSIAQIEIIRGPGSVLYGSNAFIGVVNIITKEYASPELNVSAGGGSFGTTQARLDGGTQIGKLKLSSGFQYFNQEGWEFADSTRVRGGVGQYGEQDYGDDVISANLDLEYENFSLSGFYGSNKMGRLSSAASVPDDYETERLFLDIGWQDSLSSNYNLSVNFTYNFIDDKFLSTNEEVLFGNDFILEITNFFKISDRIDLLIGGSSWRQTGEQQSGTGFSVDPYDRFWHNAYTQFNFQATDWLNLVAGGQINKVPNIDLDFVPRLSAILVTPSGFGSKLSYGQAFRSPYPGETDLVVPTVVGEPNLLPEKITTYEAQVSYFTRSGNVALTYFNSKAKDKISRVPNPDPAFAQIYDNVGGVSSSGIELEGKYFFIRKSYVLGSYTYYTNESEDGQKNITRIPAHSIKIGVSYETNTLGIGVFNSFYSRPFQTEGARDGLGSLSAYNWLTAKLDWNLSKTIRSSKDFGITLEGVNLLDKRVYDPELFLGTFNAINIRPGFGLYANAYWRF